MSIVYVSKIDRKIERETFADKSLQCKKKFFLSFFTSDDNLYACLVMKIVKNTLQFTFTNHVHFNNNAAGMDRLWHTTLSRGHKFQ